LPKATQVDQITIGLIVGAANKNEIATEGETFFNNNLLATGMLPHSQTGKRKPIQLPTTEPSKGFFGSLVINCFSSIKNSNPLESNTPSNKKGIASTNKLKNKVKAMWS
jgi:hypothetical protein